MSSAALLTIQKDGETVKSVPLEGEAVVGRAEGCVIRLEDRAISRQHAVFRKTGDVIQVERKSEFAPLMINGEEKTTALLKEGDVIAIGPYLMRLSIPKTDPAPVEPRPMPAAVPRMDEGSSDDAPLPMLDEAQGLEPVVANSPVSPASEPVPELVPEEVAAPSEPLEASPPAEAEAAPGRIMLDPPTEGVEEAGSRSAVVDPIAIAAEPTQVVATASRLDVSLVFEPGQANVTEYRISKNEVSIGRGKDCDVVLNDKRASRKNAVILRNGLNFMIRDLGSANGTYVNGERVEEKDLSGGDRILVGDTEFVFKATQAGYSEMERDFMPLPVLPESSVEEGFAPHEHGASDYPAGAGGFAEGAGGPPADVGHFVPGAGQDVGTGSSIGLIPGIDGVDAKKPKGIIEKYKALPPKKRLIVLVLVLAFVWWFLSDDDAGNVAKVSHKGAKVAQVQGANGASGAAARDAIAAFNALTPDQKKFVESQHDLAFSLFQRKEYDRSIDEISKIFSLVPDYKDSREIERYAREGKRRMDAELEERKKKEEEEALKKKIAVLVNEAGDKMHQKKYDAARDLFSQILAIDPENKAVAGWQHDLQELDEERRIEAQKKMVQEEVNQQAWALYRKGVALRKDGSPREAIGAFGNVGKIEAVDRRPAALAKRQIAEIQDEIQQKLAPLLAEAKQADDAQDYVKAMADYKAVLKIEPEQKDADDAIDRIRGILHEQAKVVFMEAIIAESYSDFATAKKKFQECQKIAPEDDIYHGRCDRKLARYFKFDSDQGDVPQ